LSTSHLSVPSSFSASTAPTTSTCTERGGRGGGVPLCRVLWGPPRRGPHFPRRVLFGWIGRRCPRWSEAADGRTAGPACRGHLGEAQAPGPPLQLRGLMGRGGAVAHSARPHFSRISISAGTLAGDGRNGAAISGFLGPLVRLEQRSRRCLSRVFRNGRSPGKSVTIGGGWVPGPVKVGPRSPPNSLACESAPSAPSRTRRRRTVGSPPGPRGRGHCLLACSGSLSLPSVAASEPNLRERAQSRLSVGIVGEIRSSPRAACRPPILSPHTIPSCTR